MNMKSNEFLNNAKRRYIDEDKILKDKSVSKEEKDAIWLKRANQNAAHSRSKKTAKEDQAKWKDMSGLFGVSEIKDGLIHYRGQYYGAAIEIPPVEFRFFSSYRKRSSIENGVGRILKSVGMNYATNIVKIERPILYHTYRENEVKKLEELRIVYEKGMMSEEELKVVLAEIIAQVGAAGPQDMGKVMGVATKQLAGKAEGKTINMVVRQLLAK